MKQASPEFLTGVEFNQELVLSLTKKKYHRLENSRVQIEACNQGYILNFFSLKLELWFRSYDILNETRCILSKYSLAYALKTDTTAI